MVFFNIDSIHNRDERVVKRVHRLIKEPAWKYFKYDIQGLEKIPKDGCLYVGNHSSGLITPDTFLFCGAVYEKYGLKGMPYSLAHEVILKLPVFHQLFTKLGVIRASNENAQRVLAAGGKILVYPGGDVENMRPYRQRDKIVFDGRRGFIRTALKAGVPVVPVVTAGAHETFMILDDMRWLAKGLRLDKIFRLKVLPLTLSVPWGVTLGVLPLYWPLPTQIIAEVLDPITFSRSGPDAADDDEYVEACGQKVEETMQSALTRLAKARQKLN